jgi:site-specific recombinase XerD
VAIRLEDLLASFRRHLRAAAKAPRTIELYGQSLEYFSRWLADRGRPATLDELTRHAISAWLAELAETCEPSTVGTRLRGMRRSAAGWSLKAKWRRPPPTASRSPPA